MKCIKYLQDQKIVRVSNEIADKAVKEGIAIHVKKEEWRQSGRKTT